MLNIVQQYYNRDPGYEWARLERHRTEYAVTMRALDNHLPSPPAAVLDIGGGPGRYAIALAQAGYRCTLFDLSEELLAFAQTKAAEYSVELENTIHGTATDLSVFPAAHFDAVLLMGPLYHLHTEADRLQAVQEACRVLKPGGIIAASFITRYAVIRDIARKDPERVRARQALYTEILETGIYHASDETGFTSAYFASPSEIPGLMADGGFTQRALIGCEGVVSMIDDLINSLTGPDWDLWVDLNYRLGHDPSTHGGAEHLLYIGQKPLGGG